MKTIGIIFFAFLVLCSVPLNASTMIHLSIEEMTVASDDIVRGKVVGKQSVLSKDQRTIRTIVTIKVLEWIKDGGEKPSTITIRQMGGTIGGRTQIIDGNAAFHYSEEVVLFLRKKSVSQNEGYYFLVGMGQTKFSVIRHLERQTIVTRKLDGIVFLAQGKKVEKPSSVDIQAFKLEAFIKRIRAALAKGNEVD